MKYKVKYFYLASGMEGIADERDCGTFEGDSKSAAIEKATIAEYPVDKMYGPNNSFSARQFYRGCLSATEI